MADNGWIKLHRKLLDWEWYSDVNTTRLFIHLLLTVNVNDYDWHGVHVPRGSRITSRATLADETNLSERQVRTALDHLISTNEITRQTTSQYTLITVINYDSYQSERKSDRPTERPTNERQNDQQTDQANSGQKSLQSEFFDGFVKMGDQQTDQASTSETTSGATKHRPAKRPTARPTNDQPNDQRSDQVNSSQESLQSAACDGFDETERPAKRPTARPTNDRQTDQRSDHYIRRKEDKNIDAAITRARASERESFCQKIESAFGKLTGKLINGADARTIFALYEQCTDADLIVESMKKSAAKFNPKYIGDKIQSFNYFVPAINDAIHKTGRCSHGDAGRSNGQAAVGSSAFTGEVRNGTPSGFSSD